MGLNEVTPLLADIEQVGSQLKEFEVCLQFFVLVQRKAMSFISLCHL